MGNWLARMKRWDFVLPGFGLWLYLGRIAAEASMAIWPWWALLSLAAGCVVLGVGLAALGRRYNLDMAPAMVLWAYALYPRLDLSLAWAIGLIAVMAMIIANLHVHFAIEPIVFASSFALYLHTLAPTVLPADSGEFQLVSRLLGIAHPPGYPLYTMLGKFFTELVPIGDAAYRLNLMSALFAALTLALACRIVRMATGSPWGGLVSSIALGAAPTFWAQATTANIRSLTAFFAALSLFALASYAHSKRSVYLILFGLAFGLGVTHHGSLAFLALPFSAYLLTVDPSVLTRVRLLFKLSGAFLLSLIVLLYLPIRSQMGTPFGPTDLASLKGFLEYVLAKGFRGDMFYFAKPAFLPDRLRVLVNILDIQFGVALLVLALLGGLAMLKYKPCFLILIGGAFMVNAFVAITYRAPQTVEYLMPAYVALSISIGYGASAADRIPSRSLRAIAMAALLLLAGLNAKRNYPSFVQLSRDYSTRRYAEQVLREAPQGAVILSNWHWATPFWYLQRCEGMRPDVKVEYVYPEGATPMPELWLRRIGENLGERPVVVTNFYPEFEAAPYRFLPLGDAFLVQDGPLFTAPRELIRLDADFEGEIRLLGYQLLSEKPPAVKLYWQPLRKLNRDYSFFVHLIDGQGRVWGQMDATHHAARYQVGEVLADRYHIAVLPTAPPGRYRLIAGVYVTFPDGSWRRLTTKEGKDAIILREVKVTASSEPPVTLLPLHRTFANGLDLIGVDYEMGPEGDKLYLHWHRATAGADCEILELLHNWLTGLDSTIFSYWGPKFAHNGVLWPPKTTSCGPKVPKTGRFRNSLRSLRYCATTLLLYADGRMIDRRLVRFGKGYLTTAHNLPPRASSLRLELRAEDGSIIPELGPWHWPRVGPLVLPSPPRRSRYVNLGGEILLTDARWKAKGNEVVVDLRFSALRPIVHDYTVSVRLADVEGRWSVQDDSTPASGAIPTLKWIRETSVADRHVLVLPSNVVSGEAKLSLLVYDAFTLRPLAILDERLAKLGPFVPLGRVKVSAADD